MIIEESTYLAHHGVRGMHWGVRKQRAASGATKAQKRKGNLKFARNATIAIGLGVAVGLLAGKAAGKTIRASQLHKAARAFDPSVKAMMTKNGRTAASSVRPPAGAKKKLGEMSPEAKKFIGEFTAKHNETIRSANADLKAMDNKLSIPIHAREYLQEWT